MTTLNKDQLTDLVDEFVSFQINDMSQDDIYQYLSDVMRQNIINSKSHLTLQESLKEQIDEYDENLYEILEDYVLDVPDSYNNMLEFMHDRHANDWIDN